ncbi:MAG: hypothetical protein AB4038_09455 [Prochloraceae cyanobacterium]
MKTYLIHVQVLKNGQVEDVENLEVTAWDRDIGIDDLLGKGTTDKSGFTDIQFTDTDYQNLFEKLFKKIFGGRDPDLYFTLKSRGEFLGSTRRNVLWNMSPEALTQQDSLEFLPRSILDRRSPYSLKIHRYEYTTETSEPSQEDNMSNGTQTGQNPQGSDRDPNRTIIVDALPALDQIAETGRRTSVSSDTTSPGGNLESILDNAFSQTLGSSLNISDPKLFEASLTRTFTPKEQRGRTVYEWIPQSYAATTDLGGKVTGAQASLYYRAKVILDHVLNLLGKLTPLDPASDKENSSAVQSIIRTELKELVNELGYPGGPRVQRVEQLFQQLLGPGRTGQEEGELGRLAEFLGLMPNRINTIEEEQNYSDFLILRDYTTSLYNSWKRYMVDDQSEAYLGPQLVDLSRALDVVAESVREAYRIMDLYFLGPAERTSVFLDFLKAGEPDDSNDGYRKFSLPDGSEYRFRFDDPNNSDQTPKGDPHNGKGPNLANKLTVAELLSWTLRFATEEGPQLAREGGKIGITEALEEIAFTLMVLVQAAAETPTANTAFQREGVVRSLKDLAFQLFEVKRLASEIELPDSL